ncbi:pericentriolar material 1 isoform X1, partial [Brachionus plicatilis]
MATFGKDYGEDIEEDQIKNWQFQQTKMNKSLNELIQNLNYGKSPNSKNDTSSGPRDLELTNLEADADLKNSSQSAAEFKRYLEDLKRSYLEKLAFSCPPKITKKISTLQSDANDQSSIDNNNKLKSVENLSNFLKKKSDLYANETNSARRALFNDKNKSQEETSDKKSLLIDQNSAEPELSNTQILSRLVQIRDYLKQAYSMLTTLQTSNNPINYSAQMNKLHCLIDHLKDQEKGYMDLLNSLSKFQEMNQSIYSSAKETNENKKISIDNSFTNDSEAGSICGSFISDTLTLNCANANGINEIMDKYRKSINRAPNDPNELVVVGKSFNKSLENEEDERTENDQDALEFDDDYLSNLIKSAKKNQVDSEQKEDAIRQMNIDRDTLEQLREQKQLLKSIRLRKEELKALEGRRKALEALKKIATDGEEEANDAFNILPITDQPKQENLINPSSICINRGVQTETLTPRKPMIRKTVKSKDLSLSQENVECVQIEPSSQIEKSKVTAKHYEDLIRKILTEKYSENLVKTVSASDLLGVGQSETCQKKLEQVIKEECTENEAQEELKLKLKDLADHEKKLE